MKKKKSGSKTNPSFTRQPGNLPNYMKSTTSADARREGSKVSTKKRSPRSSPHHSSLHRKDSTTSRQETTLIRKGGTSSGCLEVARATCSSTLQGSSRLKVCPYSYCSFNGHLRAHVPPLKCFVSARRRELNVKRNVKLPKSRPSGGGGEIVGRKESATSNSDQTHEISGSQKSFDEEDLSAHSLFTTDNWDSVSLSSEKIVVKNDSSSQANQIPSIGSDTTMLCNDMDGEQHDLKDSKHDKDYQAESFNGASTKDLTNEPYPRDSSAIEGHEWNSRNKTEDTSSNRDKSNQEPDEPRHLNPPEAGAEKVNLRHQEVDARKNAEEWMVDYALRQGGTATQRKVGLLVEAFERVVATSKHQHGLS